MKIDDLLKKLVEAGGSDAHLKVGMPPGFRIAGEIKPQGDERLMPDDTMNLAREVLDQEQWECFEANGDLDCSYSLPGTARFRVNVMRQRGSISLVMRFIFFYPATINFIFFNYFLFFFFQIFSY